MKNLPGKPRGNLTLETDSNGSMNKSTPGTNGKKTKAEDRETQRKLLKLHRKIIALEKLDIRRQKALVSDMDMANACRRLCYRSKDYMAVLQDRKIVCISPALAKLLGYSRKEMLNTSLASYIHPQELFRVAGYYLSRVTGGKAPSIYSTIIKRRDGTDIHVELMAGTFPLYGKPADLIIVREQTE